MKKLLLGLATVGIAASAAGALYAASPDTPPAAPMARGAGRMAAPVTWAEVKAAADARWAKLDVNNDGKLDQADREAKALQRFDAMDANHDGSVSRAEYLAHVREGETRRAAFAQRFRGGQGAGAASAPADGNASGDRMAHGMGERSGRRWAGRGGWGGGRLAFLLGPVHGSDGVLTHAAYDAAVKARFDKADTNHDGALSRDELRSARPMPPMKRDGERMPPPAGAEGGFPPPPPEDE